MPSVEQCRAYAAEYKLLGAHPKNSARRSAVLTNISRSWAALANQLASLAGIEKSEESKRRRRCCAHSGLATPQTHSGCWLLVSSCAFSSFLTLPAPRLKSHDLDQGG